MTFSNAIGQARTIADREDTAQLEKGIVDFRSVNALPVISVKIIKDGKMFFKHGEGIARRGAKADGDTIYHVMNSYVMAMEAEELCGPKHLLAVRLICRISR